jgi:hypothetical protein
MKFRSGLLVLAACAAFASSLAAGCASPNFENCRNDGECKADDDGKAFCVDSKCVGCRGEEDCKAPKVCGLDHTCKSLVVEAKPANVCL